MIRPNWTAVGALCVSLAAWGVIAEGGYRLTHDGRPGLRHALYAHATRLIDTVTRST